MGSILGAISVLDVPRNLRLKSHQYRVSNSRDIANIEFLWWLGVGGGVVCKVIFVSNPVYVMLRLSKDVVELELGQLLESMLFCIESLRNRNSINFCS